MTHVEARPAPLEVTGAAAQRIRKILDAENRSNARLRVSVSGGGCSGFQYGFTIDDTQETDDVLIEKDGVEVVVDGMSLMYVLGSKLDFIEDLTGSYFRVNNPNASSSCGCGTSFSI